MALFSKNIRPCHVNRSTLDKAKGITDSKAARNGLRILTPSIEIAVFAAREKGPLSPDDWETVLLAEKLKLACLSNDKNMRVECGRRSVDVMWGLEPLKILVVSRVIDVPRALRVANAIHEVNPQRIHTEIIELFRSQVADIAKVLRTECD